MSRVYNFSAGPAVLPESVLRQAQDELLELPGAGASVLEISHRSPPYAEIQAAAEANLRQLMALPDNYRVLFLQGGSRLQFSMVPMNLMQGRAADYLVTGSWGQKAVAEARREGNVNIAWDGKESNYDRLPSADELALNSGAAYLHYTSNETIQGVQFPGEPDVGDVPLVCDASSEFLYRPLDMGKYGMIYACAQKNCGPAGVTIVVVRDDLLTDPPADMPGMLSYKNHADADSTYNTPPVFGVYMFRLVTEWLLNEIGGLEAMYQRNQEKAALLYDTIDRHAGFYQGHAQADCRSLMNVTFRLPSDELQATFLAEATKADLVQLKGHRSVGGIRASIYNAMPTEGVAALAQFMGDFAARNG